MMMMMMMTVLPKRKVLGLVADHRTALNPFCRTARFYDVFRTQSALYAQSRKWSATWEGLGSGPVTYYVDDY